MAPPLITPQTTLATTTMMKGNSIPLHNSTDMPANKLSSPIGRKDPKKLWRKVKIVMKTTSRHTSLRKEEEQLLKSIKTAQARRSSRLSMTAAKVLEKHGKMLEDYLEGEDSDVDENENDEEDDFFVNDDLFTKSEQKKTILADMRRSSNVIKISDAEKEFLTNLLESPDISDEQLEHVHKVLTSDPLYKERSESMKDEDETSDGLQDNEEEKIKSERISQQQQINLSSLCREGVWNFCTLHSFPDRNCVKYEVKPLLNNSIIKLEAEDINKDRSKNHDKENVVWEKEDEDMPEIEVIRQLSLDFACSPTIHHCKPVLDSPKPLIEKIFTNFFSFNKGAEEEKKNDIEEVVDDETEETEQESSPFYCLGTLGANDKNCSPHVLSPPLMDALRPYIPFAYRDDNYWLKYSMGRDGASIRCLLEKARHSSRTVIAVETTDGDVFGSFTSTPWRPQGRKFYGSCEAFLWKLKTSRFTDSQTHTIEDQIRLERDVEVFRWSQKNRNIQSIANPNSSLIVGGGISDDDINNNCIVNDFAYSLSSTSPNIKAANKDDNGSYGSGLVINNCLEKGTSTKCITFDSPSLVTINENDDEKTKSRKKAGIFEIANIEMWTLTPVDEIEQAEQIELGRHFIFEHSSYTDY